MNFQINILKPEEETCTSQEVIQDVCEQIKINDQTTTSDLEIKIIGINLQNNSQDNNVEAPQTYQIEQNKEQFDATLLIPAYNPFQVQQQDRGRSPVKRQSKFISQSFINDQDQQNKNEEQEQQNYIQFPELPEAPRQRSCLKDRGKFRRSTKKKMSRSFFGRPLKPFFDEEQNKLLVENVNLNSLKSSFKVNFDNQVRVERVESYKVYNVLEDELKKKIVNNSRSQFAQQQQSKPARSKQPSIADAFAPGSSSDDKVCFCVIF